VAYEKQKVKKEMQMMSIDKALEIVADENNTVMNADEINVEILHQRCTSTE